MTEISQLGFGFFKDFLLQKPYINSKNNLYMPWSSRFNFFPKLHLCFFLDYQWMKTKLETSLL
jgi:hypothetical protein